MKRSGVRMTPLRKFLMEPVYDCPESPRKEEGQLIPGAVLTCLGWTHGCNIDNLVYYLDNHIV